MSIRIGYIPYLNMVPFHQGFGPEPLKSGRFEFEFDTLSPRALGLEAEKGSIDAGAFSLVDGLRVADRYEELGMYGIGVRRAAYSVLLFSKRPIAELEGATIAVTDETSTSYRLLQVLLQHRYALEGVKYGRVGSLDTFDGSTDALLLIGDEALQARRAGVRGMPAVSDLGEEWFEWQGTPFVFARWMVRRSLAPSAKEKINELIENSLYSMEFDHSVAARKLARDRPMPGDLSGYWRDFAYRLTAEHEQSIQRFSELLKESALGSHP